MGGYLLLDSGGVERGREGLGLEALATLLEEALLPAVPPDLHHRVLPPPPSLLRVHRHLVPVPANLGPRARPQRHRFAFTRQKIKYNNVNRTLEKWGFWRVRCGAVVLRVLSVRERAGYIALLRGRVEGNGARIGADLRVCHWGGFEFEGVVEKGHFWWKREWFLVLQGGVHTTSFVPWTFTFSLPPVLCYLHGQEVRKPLGYPWF